MPSEFGSPFRNSGSGYDDSDSKNDKKLLKAFENYWSSVGITIPNQIILSDTNTKNTFKNDFPQAPFLKYACPALGFAVNHSPYIYLDRNLLHHFILQTFIVTTMTGFGYKYGVNIADQAKYNFFVGNFDKFPKEIQDALRSGDARYARKWLYPVA